MVSTHDLFTCEYKNLLSQRIKSHYANKKMLCYDARKTSKLGPYNPKKIYSAVENGH